MDTNAKGFLPPSPRGTNVTRQPSASAHSTVPSHFTCSSLSGLKQAHFPNSSLSVQRQMLFSDVVSQLNTPCDTWHHQGQGYTHPQTHNLAMLAPLGPGLHTHIHTHPCWHHPGPEIHRHMGSANGIITLLGDFSCVISTEVKRGTDR